MGKKIFVVDDEKDIQDIIGINLGAEGYEVSCHSSAEEALAALKAGAPDLFILDVMMPGMDGFEFCRKVRAHDAWSGIPIIFLSARSDEIDRVLGLELGGDDYMTKPFSVKELMSRVKAMFRRTSRSDTAGIASGVLAFEGIALNPEQRSLAVDGQPVDLTKTEFEILRLFLENPGKVFTRDNIIDSIKGQDTYVIDRTVDVHVMNLRKKLGPYKSAIRTISGIGYGFRK